MLTRYTSKQNTETGKFEIHKITDDPDTHAATSDEVVAVFDTSPENDPNPDEA